MEGRRKRGREGAPKGWLTPPHVPNPEKYPGCVATLPDNTLVADWVRCFPMKSVGGSEKIRMMRPTDD